MTLNEHIGQRLKALRLKNNLTVMELSKLLGVSAMQVYKYESGRDNLSFMMVFKLSRALDITLTRTLAKLVRGYDYNS